MLARIRVRSGTVSAAKHSFARIDQRTQALSDFPLSGFATNSGFGDACMLTTRRLFQSALRARSLHLHSASQARFFSAEVAQKKPPTDKFQQDRKPKAETDFTEAREATEAFTASPEELPKNISRFRKRINGSHFNGKAEAYLLPGIGEVNPEMACISAAVAAFLVYDFYRRRHREPLEEITMQDLMRRHLAHGHVQRIQIVNKSTGRVLLRHDCPEEYAGLKFSLKLGAPEAFEDKIEQFQADMGTPPLEYVPVQYISETSLVEEFRVMLPGLLMLVLYAISLKSNM